MLIVLMFVMVDLTILTIVTAIDGARYTARTIRDRENPDIMTVSQLSLWVVGTAQLSCLTSTQLHVLVVVCLSTILCVINYTSLVPRPRPAFRRY